MTPEEYRLAVAELDRQMDEMLWINLGGGSASFKSHVAEALEIDYPGQILVIDEVATELLQKLVPRPGRDIRYSMLWQAIFQDMVAGSQIPANRLWALAAIERGGIRAIATDRTDLNGGDYWPDGHTSFCNMFGIDIERALRRIKIHFHLQSLSVYNPAAYEKNSEIGNSGRFEPLQESQALCHRAWKAWSVIHPRCVFVPGHQKAWRRIELVEELVDNLLRGDNDALDNLARQYSAPPEEFQKFYANGNP